MFILKQIKDLYDKNCCDIIRRSTGDICINLSDIIYYNLEQSINFESEYYKNKNIPYSNRWAVLEIILKNMSKSISIHINYTEYLEFKKQMKNVNTKNNPIYKHVHPEVDDAPDGINIEYFSNSTLDDKCGLDVEKLKCQQFRLPLNKRR